MEKTGYLLTNLSDQDLIDLAVEEKSEAAFFTLYSRYIKGLKTYIARLTDNENDVEDIAVISFNKAFLQLSNYDNKHKFTTWLYTIARNSTYDLQNKEIVRGKLDRMDMSVANKELIDIADNTISPEETVINAQDHELLIDCIGSLPDIYKDVAQLCFIENLGYKEIAQKLDLNINTIKTRISRAKSILIHKMKNQETDYELQ